MEYVVILIILLGWALLRAIHERQERLIAKKGYRAYIGSKRWKRVSGASKKRDSYRWRLCGRTPPVVTLESHHPGKWGYSHLYNEKPEHLTTLCSECHRWYTAWDKLGRQPIS